MLSTWGGYVRSWDDLTAIINAWWCLVGVLCALTVSSAYAQDQESTHVHIVTGEIPPYAYTVDARLDGVATRIVRELIQRTGTTETILVLPWARAILSSTQDEVLTYPIARLPYREEQYQWIGPILSDTFSFSVLAANDKAFTQPKQFTHLSVAVNRGAPTGKILKAKGFTRIFPVASEASCAKMLLAGRLDAWYTSDLITQHTMKQLGEDLTKIRRSVSSHRIDMYIAASLQVPNDVVAQWQAHLDAMKADGAYEAILMEYDIAPTGGALTEP